MLKVKIIVENLFNDPKEVQKILSAHKVNIVKSTESINGRIIYTILVPEEILSKLLGELNDKTYAGARVIRQKRYKVIIPERNKMEVWKYGSSLQNAQIIVIGEQIGMAKGKTLCNLCGKEFDMWDEQENFGIHTQVGYGSIYEDNYIDLDLCCSCFDGQMNKLVPLCKINPVTSH